MMKYTLFIIFLAFNSTICQAQTKTFIDSLQHELVIAKDDTTRVKVLAKIGYFYRLGNTDSSLFYGHKALKMAQRIHYAFGEMWAYSMMAITMEQLGNLPKALEMGFKALKIARDNNLVHRSGGALNAIGETYIILKDYPTAITYFRKQKVFAESVENLESIAYACYDMGYAFSEMNELDSAIHYEQIAITNFTKMGREEPFTYKVLGEVAMKAGNKNEALNYYHKSLGISLKNNERRATAYTYNKLAAFYKSFNKTDSAIYYATKGLEESTAIAQKKTLQEAAALLSSLYEQKDIKESLRYLQISGAYKDSLYGTNNIQAVQSLVKREEEYQQETEAAQLRYQNKLKQYFLFGGLGILFLIAFILYRNNRQKQKANVVLQEQKQKVENTLLELKSTQQQLIQSEKMASLGELTAGIAHEIQNPLNFVNNFSEVNTELIDEAGQEIDKGNIDEAKIILNDIKENEQKINHHGKRADAIVKGMLQHSRSSNGVKEPTDINALCDEYLRLSYHGLMAKDKSFNATIKTDFDNSIGNINIIPQDIGRVILNLINNAFYTVDEKTKSGVAGYEPTVSVTSKKINGNIEIKVADNGNGIPQKIIDKIFQPFFTTKPTGQGTGLGLSLSYDIVKAHGGELKVETKENEGSEFVILLPI